MPDYRPRKPGTGFNIFSSGEMVTVYSATIVSDGTVVHLPAPVTRKESRTARLYVEDVYRYLEGKLSSMSLHARYSRVSIRGHALEVDPGTLAFMAVMGSLDDIGGT